MVDFAIATEALELFNNLVHLKKELVIEAFNHHDIDALFEDIELPVY